MPTPEEMLAHENAIRASRGRKPRELSPQLCDCAQNLASNIASGKWPFSHNVGGGLVARVAATGFKASAMAENLAEGQRSIEEAFSSWMSSPGHRANMLNDMQYAGYGQSGDVWAATYADGTGDSGNGGGGGSGGGGSGGTGSRPWWRIVLDLFRGRR